MEEKVIISSFNHYSILRMKNIAPNLKYGLLSETWLINAGKYTHDLGIQCYHPVHYNLVPEVIDEIKKYGIEINTYTVNKESDIRYLIEKGIDIIIGNFPDLTGKIIKEYK